MPKGPRRPSEPELFGAADAAEAYGVRQSNLRTVAGLPRPYMKVRATTLWRADEIREHAAQWNAAKRNKGDQRNANRELSAAAD